VAPQRRCRLLVPVANDAIAVVNLPALALVVRCAQAGAGGDLLRTHVDVLARLL